MKSNLEKQIEETQDKSNSLKYQNQIEKLKKQLSNKKEAIKDIRNDIDDLMKQL